MTAYVALLRGINVGRSKRVPMAELRRLTETLGGDDVTTVLNSGNVVFTRRTKAPAKLAAELATAVEDELGVSARVIVKSAAEFTAILDDNPFADRAPDPSRMLVAFTQTDDELAPLAALAALATSPEEFAAGAHAAYLHCPGNILESRLGKALLGKAGAAATTRNLATCLKLRALLDERA